MVAVIGFFSTIASDLFFNVHPYLLSYVVAGLDFWDFLSLMVQINQISLIVEGYLPELLQLVLEVFELFLNLENHLFGVNAFLDDSEVIVIRLSYFFQVLDMLEQFAMRCRLK